MVAAAGPLTNFFIAVFFGAILRLLYLIPNTPPTLHIFLMIIIWINLLLAVFNLIPIPPLDGSKLLFSILPPSWMGVEVWLERYGFFLLLLFIFFGFELIFPVIKLLFRVVSGRFFGF